MSQKAAPGNQMGGGTLVAYYVESSVFYNRDLQLSFNSNWIFSRVSTLENTEKWRNVPNSIKMD